MDVIGAIDAVRTVSRSQFLINLAIRDPLVRRALKNNRPSLDPPVTHQTPLETPARKPTIKAEQTPALNNNKLADDRCHHQYTWKGYAKVCTTCGDVQRTR